MPLTTISNRDGTIRVFGIARCDCGRTLAALDFRCIDANNWTWICSDCHRAIAEFVGTYTRVES